MTELTMGIIYTIKHQNGDPHTAIQKFLQKHFASDYDYDRDFIDRILRQTCADYISTADDPVEEMRRYFLNSNIFSAFEISEYKRMITFIQNIKVKKIKVEKNYEYINGFKEMEGV